MRLHLHEYLSGAVKCIGTESTVVVARALGEEGMRKMRSHLMGMEFQFCGMEKCWRAVVLQCEYT